MRRTPIVINIDDYVEVTSPKSSFFGLMGQVKSISMIPNGSDGDRQMQKKVFEVEFRECVSKYSGRTRVLSVSQVRKINPLYSYLKSFDAEAPSAEPKNLTYGQLSDFNLPLSEQVYGHDWGREAIEPRDFHLDHV